MQLRSITLFTAALVFAGGALAADDIPRDLVVDVRVFEARTTTPDFNAMQELAFFINTDGEGVTEAQWLGTIARQATGSFLATLALETVALDSPTVELELAKRSRRLKLSADLSGFVPEGVFDATVSGELARGDDIQRSFEQTIELRLGQTYVWSGRGLELAASEYLSHFRDYEDRDGREELYSRLRDYTTFLIVAMTLRHGEARAPDAVVSLEAPEVADFESPFGVEIVGTIELELDIGAQGTPTHARILRSSIPELNSQILSEAESWSYPDAAGETGRMTLDLRASP
jgi:hypothetical protein